MIIHIVSAAETVDSIARRYGVSAQRIISDNAILAPNDLVVGQALVILIPQIVHTVSAGQTLASIAAQYGVSEIQLIQNNPYLIDRAPTVYAGEQIIISFTEPKRREITLNGYAYPFINRTVLMRALPYLTYLTIFGYGFREDGSLILIDDTPLIRLAYDFDTAPIMLLSSITEDGNFSSEKASELFQNVALQNAVLDNIVAVMQEKGYVGLDIDFEYVEQKDAQAFLDFLGNAGARMRENGFFLHTDLAPKTSGNQAGLLYEAHNYPAIGALSDMVLLMTYEWGYTYGPPMAVAPIDRVRDVVEYGASVIPPEKILMGIPNYGYDWPLPFEKGKTRATSIGNQDAIDLARIYGAAIRFDSTSQSPYFEYVSQDAVKHIVWFEDARSVLAKFDLIDEFDLLGGGYWNVMRPFAQNWALVSALYEIRKVV